MEVAIPTTLGSQALVPGEEHVEEDDETGTWRRNRLFQTFLSLSLPPAQCVSERLCMKLGHGHHPPTTNTAPGLKDVK
eukprot:2417290-Amphidinium_carterae.1